MECFKRINSINGRYLSLTFSPLDLQNSFIIKMKVIIYTGTNRQKKIPDDKDRIMLPRATVIYPSGRLKHIVSEKTQEHVVQDLLPSALSK